jgi:CBS domain containing-hemolysin-like protein
MTLDHTKIEDLLGKVFDELQTIEDKQEYVKRKQKFIFHMTDWLDDLQDLIEMYQQIEQYKGNSVQTIAGFLYHVIPHLNASGRLLLDHIPDHFKDGQE